MAECTAFTANEIDLKPGVDYTCYAATTVTTGCVQGSAYLNASFDGRYGALRIDVQRDGSAIAANGGAGSIGNSGSNSDGARVDAGEAAGTHGTSIFDNLFYQPFSLSVYAKVQSDMPQQSFTVMLYCGGMFCFCFASYRIFA